MKGVFAFPSTEIGAFNIRCPKCDKVVTDIEIIVCGDDLCSEVMEAEIKRVTLKRVCDSIEED